MEWAVKYEYLSSDGESWLTVDQFFDTYSEARAYLYDVLDDVRFVRKATIYNTKMQEF